MNNKPLYIGCVLHCVLKTVSACSVVYHWHRNQLKMVRIVCMEKNYITIWHDRTGGAIASLMHTLCALYRCALGEQHNVNSVLVNFMHRWNYRDSHIIAALS